jgi:hypothetical protein
MPVFIPRNVVLPAKQISWSFITFPAHKVRLAKPEFVLVVATKNCDPDKWRRAVWQEFKMSEPNA